MDGYQRPHGQPADRHGNAAHPAGGTRVVNVPVPSVALRAILGKMASVLLEGQRVLPEVALARGFRFRHPELGGALADITSDPAVTLFRRQKIREIFERGPE